MASNQVGARLVFENAKNFVQSQGYDVSQAVLTQSYVRSEVALSATAATYTLPIVTNSSLPTFNTARPVQLQDVHVVSEIGFFVAVPGSSTATNFKLFTYPNTSVFSTSGAAAALNTLYNGYLNIQVNNQNVLPAIDIYRSYFVPQTQQAANAGYSASGISLQDQNDGNLSGFTAIEPNLLLNGAANINAQVVLPGAIDTIQSGARLVVIFRTILCQNVTSVK